MKIIHYSLYRANVHAMYERARRTRCGVLIGYAPDWQDVEDDELLTCKNCRKMMEFRGESF